MSCLLKTNDSDKKAPYIKLNKPEYRIAGTISKFLFFLTIITKIEKLIGIISATRFQKNVPDENESPTINIIPVIAKKMEIKVKSEIFSFK